MITIIATGVPEDNHTNLEFKRYLLNSELLSGKKTDGGDSQLRIVTASDVPTLPESLTIFVHRDASCADDTMEYQRLISGLAVRAHSFAYDNIPSCQVVEIIQYQAVGADPMSMPIERA